MSTLSWSLLKLRRLGQLVFVKCLMSHLGCWLGCVCVCVHKMAPEFWAMVTHRPGVSVFPYNPSPLTGICVGCKVGTFESESNNLLVVLQFNRRKRTLLSNVCTFCCANIEPGWMHKYTKHCVSKELEFGPCSSINSGFLLSWVQLFPVWAKCLLLWLYVLQFKHSSNFNPN